MNTEITKKNYFSEMLKLRVLVEGLSEINEDTFTEEEKELITELVIPEEITILNDRAFKGCHRLKTITIPEGVTFIGTNAFQDCRKLTSLTIPASVDCVGPAMFYNCRHLENNVTFKGKTSRDLWRLRISLGDRKFVKKS